MFDIRKLPILIEMVRPHGLITPLCAWFAGLYLANHGFPGFTDLFGSFAIIILVWFGGVILNDYFDYHVDAITDSYRPIPSGRVSRKDAFFLSIIFFIIAIILSLFISIKLLFATLILLILVILYNSRLKKYGLAGSLCFGLIEGSAFTIGVYTISGFDQLTLLVVISIIMLHTSVNIIGAIKDTKGDRQIGNLTVPAKYGISVTVKLALMFMLFSLIAALLPAFLNLLKLRYLPLLLIVCFWFFVIIFQVRKNPELGYMGFGMYYMGASVYYINFITGI